MSDLRAAVEALDCERGPVDWPKGRPDQAAWTELVRRDVVLAIIDAHQCYDVDALAEALHMTYRPSRLTFSDEDADRHQAAAIIARLHEAKEAK